MPSAGSRRPVQVLAGNREVMAGVCPWFDDIKKQKSA
jgi:hypothetical protein